MDVGQAKIASRMTIRKLFVIQPQQVQHGGVQVVHVNPVFNGAMAEIIGRTVRHTASHPATGQPDREPIRIVIGPAAILSLSVRIASKLPAPPNKRVFEQASLLEILKQIWSPRQLDRPIWPPARVATVPHRDPCWRIRPREA